MEQTSARQYGRMQVAVAALMWSSSGIFAKAPMFASWPVEQRGPVLAVYRALFAGLVLLPLVRCVRWDWRLIPMALAYVALSFSYLQALTLTTAANAIWLQSTAPLWVALIAVAMGWETPTRRDLVTLALIAAGLSLIVGMELTNHTQGSTSTAGVMWGLGSGVGFALIVLSLRQLREHHPAFLTAVNQFSAALLLAPFAATASFGPSSTQWLVLVAFGALQLGVPYFLFARGLRHIRSSEGAMIGLIEPLMLPLWTFLVWGEGVAWWTIGGAGLILAGLIVRYGPGSGRERGEGTG